MPGAVVAAALESDQLFLVIVVEKVPNLKQKKIVHKMHHFWDWEIAPSLAAVVYGAPEVCEGSAGIWTLVQDHVLVSRWGNQPGAPVGHTARRIGEVAPVPLNRTRKNARNNLNFLRVSLAFPHALDSGRRHRGVCAGVQSKAVDAFVTGENTGIQQRFSIFTEPNISLIHYYILYTVIVPYV